MGLNSDTTNLIKFYGITDIMKQEKGIIQGDSMSPFSFSALRKKIELQRYMCTPIKMDQEKVVS